MKILFLIILLTTLSGCVMIPQECLIEHHHTYTADSGTHSWDYKEINTPHFHSCVPYNYNCCNTPRKARKVYYYE
jgi:hypothetical protein